jgi:putative membrane protein
LITAVAVAAAVWLVPGVAVLGKNAVISIAILAAVLALLNAVIKPILQVLALPITFITLGLFALVVNTAILYLAANLGNALFSTDFIIDSFWSAFCASVIISIVTVILNALTGAKDPARNRDR